MLGFIALTEVYRAYLVSQKVLLFEKSPKFYYKADLQFFWQVDQRSNHLTSSSLSYDWFES